MTQPLDDDHPSAEQLAADLSPEQVAAEIRGTLAVLYRRIRQTKQIGELTLPESSALSRLQHGGPMTAAKLQAARDLGAQVITLTDPADTIEVIARAATRALTA